MRTFKHSLVAIPLIASFVFSSMGKAADEKTVNGNQIIDNDSLATLRDPFWPIGYRPVPKTKKEAQAKISRIRARTHWPTIKLRGVTRHGENKYIAILEGIGLVEPGDVVAIKKEGLIYRWRINDVNENGISRTRLDVREATSVLQNEE
jgi:hypothetical protein